jgi:hypothetical protein
MRYRFFALIALFSLFLLNSASEGAIRTSEIEVVSNKDVLDSSDFAVIDKFVSNGVNELLRTTDFSSIAAARSTIIRYSVSSRGSAQNQYSRQFFESAYNHLGRAFQEVNSIEPSRQRDRVVINLLILIDSLGNLRLTEYAVQNLNNENTIARYWAIHCVSNSTVVEQMNSAGADGLLLAKEVGGHLQAQIESARAEELSLILRFASNVNLKEGEDIVLQIADIRINRYANWTVDYELLEATLLTSLYNKFSTGNGEKQKAFGKRFCVLFSYVIQRYIKGVDRLNYTHKRQLASVMVDIEVNCVSAFLNKPQITMRRAIEGESLSSLLQEHNRLLGDETKAGEIPKRLNITYESTDGSNHTYPPVLSEPPQ